MTIERTSTRAVPKPWGNTDLRPWSSRHADGAPIGEIWFQRSEATAPDCALLLKLLFTTEPLSIQVHPDDTFARSIGLDHGKSEAWYILSALPGARIALGLMHPLDKPQLRRSIDEGSLPELVRWRAVAPEDVIFVSAGMIHAVGPGLVVLEIQQRSDVTFRLFDHGRRRELQVENAIAAASDEQAAQQAPMRTLTSARTLLLASPSFVLERFDLPPDSNWELLAAQETWLFVLGGHARIGSIDLCMGEVTFLEADTARLQVGSSGLKGLMAYVGCEPAPNLLRERASVTSGSNVRPDCSVAQARA
jgi:mannose-6-phosphate isomerase